MSSRRRRVVVTGLGMVSPLGNTVEDSWEALIAGETGAGPITRFDATDFPVKHGGVSAQLADSIAQSVAALAGACPGPSPFEPVLEGVLLTGGTPRYLRGRPTGGHGAESELTEVSRRTAPVKIAARYLTPHLVQPGSFQVGAPA